MHPKNHNIKLDKQKKEIPIIAKYSLYLYFFPLLMHNIKGYGYI